MVDHRKTDRLGALLRELALMLGPESFQIVDRWPDDHGAVGIVSQVAPSHLLFLSTHDQRPGRSYYECQVLAADGGRVRVIGSKSNATLREVAAAAKGHLHL